MYHILSSGTYAALSYCWGGPQTVTSTMATIQDRTQGVTMQSFPQTIQDAIYVTQNLGLRHIWIDALCILQDSPEDKAHELGQMARIYANSYVTIAATSARSVSEVFLQTREPRAQDPKWFPLPFTCPNGQMGTISVRDHFPIQGRQRVHKPPHLNAAGRYLVSPCTVV
jgi:hypothetical protein